MSRSPIRVFSLADRKYLRDMFRKLVDAPPISHRIEHIDPRAYHCSVPSTIRERGHFANSRADQHSPTFGITLKPAA